MLLKEKGADLWRGRGDTLLSLNDLKYHAADSRFQFTSIKFQFTWEITILNKKNISILKGLGHAILGNFSIDQVVIELTEITK